VSDRDDIHQLNSHREDESGSSQTHPAKRSRETARRGLQQQAKRMLARSSKALPVVTEGANVAVPVSAFDRSKGDPPNVIGVIISVGNIGYIIGTSRGIIKGRLARNQFELVKYSGLQAENVPQTELTLREIVRADSVCGGQGYQKCQCRGHCLLRRCSCFKAGLRCNSACHNHRICDNIDK